MTRFAPTESETWPTRQMYKQERARSDADPHTTGGESRGRLPVRREPIDDEPAVYDCIQATLDRDGGRNA